MCLAAVCSIGFDIEDLCDGINDAWDANSHGAGYAYAKNGQLFFSKGYTSSQQLCMKLRKMHADGLFDSSDLLVHLRYTSSGENSVANCHPFITGQYAMIHNGTVSRYAHDKVKSDTSILADVLAGLPHDHVKNDAYVSIIEELLGNSKIALLGSDGTSYVYNRCLWDYTSPEKILYSNSYWTGVKRVGAETSPKEVNTLEIEYDSLHEDAWRAYANMSN